MSPAQTSLFGGGLQSHERDTGSARPLLADAVREFGREVDRPETEARDGTEIARTMTAASLERKTERAEVTDRL
jgi:hypothetical protein